MKEGLLQFFTNSSLSIIFEGTDSMKISQETFRKSGNWVKRNARPLEAARWRFLLEDGSRDDVLHYLAAFQNEDGGFGHGLEPDFWSPHSSPMATWTAGQILMEIRADSNEQIVQKMLTYLVSTYQNETGMWFSSVPENNDYPHAPHWYWKEGVQDNWMFNPGAELAGFLIYWSSEESVAAQIGWASTEKAITRLMDCHEMDRHEINNYQKLIEILKEHESTFRDTVGYSLQDLSEKIIGLAERSVERDASVWGTGYYALPLDFNDNPADPLYENFRELIDQNLTYYMKQMSDEGTWDITWNWSNYPEEFQVARRYWQGILAVDRYKKFQAFGCFEKGSESM